MGLFTPLRDVYDAVDMRITPVVEAAVKSDDLAHALKAIDRIRGAVGGRVEGVVASVLHTANLPAGSDIRKLRRQVAELDFEMRQWRMESAQRDAAETGGHGADS